MSNYIGKKRIVFSTIVFLTMVLAIIVSAFYYTQLKKRFIDPTGDVFKKILFKQVDFDLEFNEKILLDSVFLKLNDNHIYFVKEEAGNGNAFENPRNISDEKLEEGNLETTY
ncbi:MAG: hypothetical protein U9O55_01535 [Patescibacteria group bacterium]|nr:hypothetical protein [Patescibacteria group bacterium]